MISDRVTSQPNAISAAANWVQAMFAGSVATALAIIAVASIGMMLMSGRLTYRRGLEVLLGCFIIFGAQSIADGVIRELGNGSDLAAVSSQPAAAFAPVPSEPSRPAQVYDPYAGAAIPPRR